MTRISQLTVAFLILSATLGSAQTPSTPIEKETGLAAVYSDALNGHVTASGQIYDPAKLTAAHKTLPFGTTVRVMNAANNKSVVLRINDRGPKQAARVLDISPAAAARLGFSPRVMREVTVEIVTLGTGMTTRQPAP